MRVPCFECALRRTGAFKPINDLELAFINEMKRDHLVCPPGGEIIAAGQDQAELYTLYAGWAIRCKTLPDGRRQILNILLPGDLIGLQGAMFEAAAYSVEAITEVQLCLLPRRKMWSLFENMPELAFDVTWLGSREESIVDENLTSTGQRTAAERIAALIIQLYKRLNVLGMVVNGAMPFPLTQQHIADTLGLSIVHTNKTLKKLSGRGLIRWQERGCDVLNGEGLAALAKWEGLDAGARPFI